MNDLLAYTSVVRRIIKLSTINKKPMTKVTDRIEKDYLPIVTKMNAQYYLLNGYTFEPAPIANVTYGKRYARVLVGNRVHTFIDLNTGDILKAATYAAPAKNGVRGNIFADDVGRSVVNYHGAKYLR